MDLSVVILNWNTRDLLAKCLETLRRPQPCLRYEIIVADNASEDGSREVVQTRFPDARLVVNPSNVGFGAGNNAALPHATGRYVLFLNSDTEVEEGALARLVRYADANPDVGIVGPKLLNADGSLQFSCRRYPNLATGFFRNTPLGRLLPNNRAAADYLMQDFDHAAPRDVDWVSGAALMIRRELLDQIGGFDESFFMYCEDVDLCWRANHAPLDSRQWAVGSSDLAVPETSGEAASESLLPAAYDLPPDKTWRVAYFPDAVIYHLIGKSSDQVPTRMTVEFHRSQYLFYKKHYAARTPLILRPLIPLGIALRASGQILRYRYRHNRRALLQMLNRNRAAKRETPAP